MFFRVPVTLAGRLLGARAISSAKPAARVGGSGFSGLSSGGYWAGGNRDVAGDRWMADDTNIDGPRVVAPRRQDTHGNARTRRNVEAIDAERQIEARLIRRDGDPVRF